jgi:MYXO-CTERM domain-containing protein
VLAGAGPAWANGALPASYGILLPAGKPQQIVLATTFGMIISEDAGKSWLWTCERPETSYGYLYGVGPPPRDRFYALSPSEGLAFSDDGSCSWQRAGGGLSGLVASDFFVDPTNADRVLAVAATIDRDGGDIGPPSLFESTDGGATFGATPLYAAPTGANIVSVEIARSNPMVVYLAMYTTPDRHPRLLRSSDGGRTWTDRDVEAGVGANEFRILIVDPNDPNVLYLRVVVFGGVEHVMVTRDAGMTFETPVTVRGGSLSAFLRLASGTVLVGALINLDGGGMSGAGYRSTDGGHTFVDWALSPQPRILGLAERDGVVYLAGKNYSDGWAIATSRDEGVTITPLSSYEDVRGVMPCAMSACGTECRTVAMQAVWTNDVCTGALLDAGLPDGGSDGGPSQMSDGGIDAGLPPQPPGSGCHCAAGEAASYGALAAWALILALLAAVRRRRR